MRWICCAIAVLIIVCGLAGCASVSTSPMESQSKPRDARVARLYFIWPRSAMLRTGTFDIKVDGQVVGKIAPDSYFFIDRPPGTYTLKVEPPFDWVYFETDVKVTAGGTSYYAINVKPLAVPIVGGGAIGVVAIAHPQIGAPMQPRERGMVAANYKLNALDATTATAEMAKLDGAR
jgi:hypothetical protein